MFREHNFSVWGTYCKCGASCGILQNEHHPWSDTGFEVTMTCPACGRKVHIDQKSAADFYSGRILSYFGGLSGSILDFGCGDGFLSRFLVGREEVENVLGLDVDPACRETLSDLCGDKFRFRQYDGNLAGALGGTSFDYLVSRDVFLLVDDTEKYFEDVSRIVTKGIRQMGWFQKDNPRMKNRLEPQQILEEYEKHGWSAEEEDLEWYPCGYFISACRKTLK